jgi:hypothetical protein
MSKDFDFDFNFSLILITLNEFFDCCWILSDGATERGGLGSVWSVRAADFAAEEHSSVIP